MEDERLAKIISNLEIVHSKLREIRDLSDFEGEILSDFNESYSLISECREMLHEEEVKNEISKLSNLDE